MPAGKDVLDEIEARWKALSVRLPDKLRQVQLKLGAKERGIGVGVDPLGCRHLLVPLPDGEGKRFVFKGASVHMHKLIFKTKGSSATWLDLHCINPELEAVFAKVCADLIDRLPDSPKRMEDTCLSILQEWKTLLGSGRSGDRSSALLGALGELLVLRRLARIDPMTALDCWEGPNGGRFDFRRKAKALEVKSTTAKTGRIVQIHGHTQMEEPGNGTLHLFFSRFEKVDRGSLSLKSLVSELGRMGLDRSAIMERLDNLGLGDEKTEEFRTGFEHLESLIYRVTDDFPRIISRQLIGGRLPKGVLSIAYAIDLDHSSMGPISAREEDTVLQEIMSSGKSKDPK
jgi:hypothetical protein